MPLELPCRGGVPTWAMWPDDAKKSGYGREEERTPDVVFLSSRMYNMLYMARIFSTGRRCPEARYFGHQFKAGGEVPDRPFCFTCVRRVCQGHCALAAAIAFSVLSFHARMGQLRSYPAARASRYRASIRSITLVSRSRSTTTEATCVSSSRIRLVYGKTSIINFSLMPLA